jgi:hypothetical protein
MDRRYADLAPTAVIAALILLGLSVGTGRSAQSGGSATFPATADAYVRSNSPTSRTSFGSHSLSPGAWTSW